MNTGKAFSEDRDLSPEQRKAEREFLEIEIERAAGGAKGSKTVLDYGCGEARFFDVWTRLGYLYVGADIVPAMMDTNAERYGATFLHVEDLDERIVTDWLFLSMTLQHMTDVEAIGVLTRIRSQKVLVIDNTVKGGPEYVQHRRAVQLTELLARAGWGDITPETARSKAAQYKIVVGRNRGD